MKRTFILTVLSVFVCILHAEVAVSSLTVEGRKNPVGIDVFKPRFGWQISTDARDLHQTSYRILVASSVENLNHNIGDVWDSGIVKSDASQWVPINSVVLAPNNEYFWKVKVSTNHGDSDWSTPSRWSTGLMDDANWKGDWIGLDSLLPGDSDSRHSRIASRYLRHDFTAKGKVRRATMHILGLGLYTSYINGSKVGEDLLTPVPTDYTRSVAYDTYDITPLLQKHNTIGVVLAGGHYFAQTQNFQTNVRTTYGFPKLIANIIIEYMDGSTDTISTDSSWTFTADGPIRYANEYDGELYDSKRTLGAWTEPGFDDSSWMKARKVNAPGGKLVGNITPAMCVYETGKPVSLRRYGNRYIADFGTNGAGRLRIKATAKDVDTIVVRHAELLASGDSLLWTDNLRSAEATAKYVSDGKSVNWTPEFTYYGFRYAEISGIDNISADDITRELIADRMDDSDTEIVIETVDGNNMLNAIVDNARRGIRSNYKGMPLDCPQRDERMPWLGDRTMGSLGESYVVNCHDLYSKWVKDICQSQCNDGSISDVAPAYWRLYNGNMTWPAALPFICDMLYRQYGDIVPMSESYDAIKKFLSFVKKKHQKGALIGYDRYGDWCVPPELPTLVHSKDSTRQTDGILIASSYYQYICPMMSKYAEMFGFTSDADYYLKESKNMASAINEAFFSDGKYSNGTVTANLLPLVMGFIPDGSEQAVTDSIIATIKDKYDGHISTGVIGIQWLMRALSDTGHGDVAYRMAIVDTYPGWGYMVKKGATTIWELWNGDTANPSMNSGNHVMLLGDLLPWCYERLGGIRPDENNPGFKHIVFKPDFSVDMIKGVKASHPTPYGLCHSEWSRDNGTTKWNVTVPANTTADVYFPSGEIKTIGSGEYMFEF